MKVNIRQTIKKIWSEPTEQQDFKIMSAAIIGVVVSFISVLPAALLSDELRQAGFLENDFSFRMFPRVISSALGICAYFVARKLNKTSQG